MDVNVNKSENGWVVKVEENFPFKEMATNTAEELESVINKIKQQNRLIKDNKLTDIASKVIYDRLSKEYIGHYELNENTIVKDLLNSALRAHVRKNLDSTITRANSVVNIYEIFGPITVSDFTVRKVCTLRDGSQTIVGEFHTPRNYHFRFEINTAHGVSLKETQKSNEMVEVCISM